MFTLSTHIELPIAHRLPGAYSGLCVGNISKDETKVFPKDNLGITFSIIKLLGNSLIEVNELNNYLGFMRRISLSKYVLMDKYTKKNYMKNALTFYKKKILRGTRESAIKFIENISIYDNLRKEEKVIITSNYKRFIDEIFNLAIATCYDLDFNLI